MGNDDLNPDFITILPATLNRACVAVMHYSWGEHEYTIKKISEALQQNAAIHLAASWAAALKLGVR